MINLQHVRAFCAIVAEGSFSRAADTLHLTQPTVSAQIQALEREVGARLIDRSAQGLSLTQPGRTFHSYAVQLLELASRSQEAMEQLQGLARGRLDLGASSVPGHYVLPPLLVRFKQEAPGVEISLCVANSHDIRTGVHEGGFEIGVVGEQARDDRLVFEPVCRDRLVAICRPEHPLASRNELHAADLAATPLVMREQGSGTRATLERALARATPPVERLNVWLELGSTEAVKMAVRAADVVAVLSEWTVADEVRQGLVCALPIADLDLSRRFYLIRRAHGTLSAASERFIDLLRAAGS